MCEQVTCGELEMPAFSRTLGSIRPKVHRGSARMGDHDAQSCEKVTSGSFFTATVLVLRRALEGVRLRTSRMGGQKLCDQRPSTATWPESRSAFTRSKNGLLTRRHQSSGEGESKSSVGERARATGARRSRPSSVRSSRAHRARRVPGYGGQGRCRVQRWGQGASPEPKGADSAAANFRSIAFAATGPAIPGRPALGAS